ncbi:MAG: type II secretion system protein [Phycisphaerae bacterium]
MIETKAPRCDPVRPRRRRGRQGFTLTEIMIALGVLAVGMGMAAGAFHAGIQSHIITVDEICRTMIGENAIAIAKARLTTDASLPDPTWDAQKKEWKVTYKQLSGTDLQQQRLGDSDTRYPIGPRSTYGFLALGARARPKPRNDFKIMVIVYEITQGGGDRNIDVGLQEVRNVILTNDPQGSGMSVALPPPGMPPKPAKLTMPAGSLLYFSELEDPFVEVKSHPTLGSALLDRHVKAETRNILVMTVKIDGVISAVGLKIRGVYLGRASLRPPGQASAS